MLADGIQEQQQEISFLKQSVTWGTSRPVVPLGRLDKLNSLWGVRKLWDS